MACDINLKILISALPFYTEDSEFWQYIDRISISMASMSQKIHKSILKVEASHIRVSKIAKCKFFRTEQIQYRQKWPLLMTRARLCPKCVMVFFSFYI